MDSASSLVMTQPVLVQFSVKNDPVLCTTSESALNCPHSMQQHSLSMVLPVMGMVDQVALQKITDTLSQPLSLTAIPKVTHMVG